MTHTLKEKAEHLDALKRKPFARCSIERLGATMDPPETWADLIEQHVFTEQIDRYLKGFVAPSGKGPCPSCGSTISFSWGLAHGQGNCWCEWPGTLYHYVYDDREDGDLLCSREKCGRRRDEHVELRCPDDDSAFAEWKPPLVVGFTRLLWAHPYSVHLRRRNAERWPEPMEATDQF